MTERVRIQSNAASPFKVSFPGVSVDGAEFNDVLFDASQQPLRVYSSGYLAVVVIPAAALGLMMGAVAGTAFPTPPGTYPLFFCVGRFNDPAVPQQLVTANASNGVGIGFTIDTDRTMWGINFRHSPAPGSDGTVSYVNFCLLRNYG